MSVSRDAAFDVTGRSPADVARALDAALTKVNGEAGVYEIRGLSYDLPDGASYMADRPSLADLEALPDFPPKLRIEVSAYRSEVKLVSVYVNESKLEVSVFSRTGESLAAFITEIAGALGTTQIKTSIQRIQDSMANFGATLSTPERSTRSKEQAAAKPEPAVLLITALREERKSVEEAFGLKTKYENGIASGVRHGLRLDLISCRRMGRVPAAVATAVHLERAKHPYRAVILLGIAGGFSEAKVDRGAVLIASEVIDLSARKLATDTEYRPVVFATSDALERFRVSARFDENAWQNNVIRADRWPNGRRPFIMHGPVVCTDEIISSDDSRGQLISEWDKVLGTETEAGGVCAAADELGQKVIVVRGVSDLADPHKADDDWRRLAMGAVIHLVDEFLKSGVLTAPT
jgi:nucleoside phosphorylase